MSQMSPELVKLIDASLAMRERCAKAEAERDLYRALHSTAVDRADKLVEAIQAHLTDCHAATIDDSPSERQDK